MNNKYENLNISTNDNINDDNLFAILSTIQNKYPNCSLNVEKNGNLYSININWTLTYTPTNDNTLENLSDTLFRQYGIRYNENYSTDIDSQYINNNDGSYSFSVNDTFYINTNETVDEALKKLNNSDELVTYSGIKNIPGVEDYTSHISENEFFSNNYINLSEGEPASFYLKKTLEKKRNIFYQEFENNYPLLNPEITIDEKGTLTVTIDDNSFSVNSLDELSEKMKKIDSNNLQFDSSKASETLKRKILEKYPYIDIDINIKNEKIEITYNGKTIKVDVNSNFDSIMTGIQNEFLNDKDNLNDYKTKYTYNKEIPSYRFYSCIDFDDETTYKDIYNSLNDTIYPKIQASGRTITSIAVGLSHPGFNSSKNLLSGYGETLNNISDDSKLLGNLIDSMVAIYKTCDKELKDIVDIFLTNDLFKDAKDFDKTNFKGDFETYINKWTEKLQNDYNKVDSIAAQMKYGYRFNASDYENIKNENNNYDWNNDDWHIVTLPSGEKYYYLNAEVFNNLYNLNDENTILNENHSAYKYMSSINLYANTAIVAPTIGEFKARIRRTIGLAPYFKYAVEDEYKEIYDVIVNNYNGENIRDIFKEIIGDDLDNISGCEMFFQDDAKYMTPSELAMAFYQLKGEYRDFYFYRGFNEDGTVNYFKNINGSTLISPNLGNFTDALRESLNEREGISDAIDYVKRITENGQVDARESNGMFISGVGDGLLSIPKGLAYLIDPSLPNSSKYYRDKYIFDYLREKYDLSSKLDGTYTPQEENMYKLLSTNGLSSYEIEGLELVNNAGKTAGQTITNVAMDLMHVPAPVRLGLRAIGEGGELAKEVYNEGRDANMARVYGFSDAVISFAVASIVDRLQNRAPTPTTPTDPFEKAVVDTGNSLARTIELMFFSNPSQYVISRVVDEGISQIETDSFNIYEDYGIDKALQDLRSLNDNFNDATNGETFGENLSSGSIFVLKTILDIMDFD